VINISVRVLSDIITCNFSLRSLHDVVFVFSNGVIFLHFTNRVDSEVAARVVLTGQRL